VDETREVWMPVPDYEGLYEVSNLGRVRSHKGSKPTIMKGGRGTCKMGYLRVTLRDAATVASARYIHILVLEAFVGPRPHGMLGLHDDGNVDNCRLSNLSWGTAAQNAQDRIRHGRVFTGSRNPNGRLTFEQIRAIRANYFSGRAKQTTLARQFGVSQAHISRIILKKSWS